MLDVRESLNDSFYKGKATPPDIFVRGVPVSAEGSRLRAAVAAAAC